MVQQVALQTKEGNPDVAPLDIDVRSLLKQFVFVTPTYFISYFHETVQQ